MEFEAISEALDIGKEITNVGRVRLKSSHSVIIYTSTMITYTFLAIASTFMLM